VARLLLGQREESLRREGLEALERAPGELPLAPVAALLQDPSSAVRLQAIALLARRGDQGAVEPLRRALVQGEREPGELEALGRALAAVAPIAASRLLGGWLRPKGRFLMGPGAQERRLQWAAVAGMAAVPGDEAERQLAALAEDAPEELRRHCLAALARRREEAHRG
jgi:HEAT repeat protein